MNLTPNTSKSLDFTIQVNKEEFIKSDDEFIKISLPELLPSESNIYKLKIRSISLEGDENLLPNKDPYDDLNLDVIFYINLMKNGILESTIRVRYDDIKPCTSEETLASVINNILQVGILQYNNRNGTAHTIECVYLREQKIMEYELKNDQSGDILIGYMYTIQYQPGLYVLGLSYTDISNPYILRDGFKLSTAVIHMIPGPKILVRCREIAGNGMIFKNEYNYKWIDVVAEFDHPESIVTNRVNFQADPFSSDYELENYMLANRELHFTVVSSNRPRVVYPLERVSIGFSIISEKDENYDKKNQLNIMNKNIINDRKKNDQLYKVNDANEYLNQYNLLLSLLGRK